MVISIIEIINLLFILLLLVFNYLFIITKIIIK